jgi:hypothetical protein
MALVILVSGQPVSGKSFASIILKTLGCVDSVLHTDEIYTGYIFTQRKDIYGDDLRQIIVAHYLHCQQTIKKEWHGHLFEVISRDAARVDRLLVEGWQLFDCVEPLSQHLGQQNHKVIHALASGRLYIPNPPSSLDLLQLADWIKTEAEAISSV